MFDGTPAVTNWADPDYFLNRFENDELIILQNGGVYDAELKSATEMTDTRKLGVQNTGKGKCSTGGYGGVQKATIMKLGDAIRGMKNGKAYYLSNVDTIFRKHNDLLNQTMLSERLSPWGYPNYRPSAAQIFMGFGSSDKKKTTGTPIHCAWGANAFCQLAGSKNWQLMPSRYAAFLHPMLSSKFPAAIGLKFPDWLPRYNVTIHAGDLLMNPSWMWHRIENLEGFNIGIATRENHPTWQIRNAAGFTLLHELSGDNQVADDAVDWMKDIPDGQKKRIKFFMSIPLLAFAVGYVKEIFGGVQPHPLIDAWQNTCDEHDPRCAVSFYDRMVYSYDDCMKELENKKD